MGLSSWHRDIPEGSTDTGEQQQQEKLTCSISNISGVGGTGVYRRQGVMKKSVLLSLVAMLQGDVHGPFCCSLKVILESKISTNEFICIVHANTMSGVPRNGKFWKQNKSLNSQFQHVILCRAVNLARRYKHSIVHILSNIAHLFSGLNIHRRLRRFVGQNMLG